jgi:pyruvate formate lyase activating enzyme
LENRCIGCHSCAEVCPRHSLSWTTAGLNIDRTRCQACGECAEECPADALELLGRRVTVDELATELAKDRAFFATSGGGVTLSGGEPTMQAGFAARLLQALKAQGISTALDTCGLCSAQTLERLVPLSDVILYDLKLLDSDRHLHFAGQPNRVILENLGWLGDYIRTQASEKALWIRTPLIPGATATGENVAAIGAFLAAQLADVVQRWELCAFNNLCRDKYRRLGLEWDYATAPLLARAELDELERIAKGAGLAPEKVAVTGAARVE